MRLNPLSLVYKKIHDMRWAVAGTNGFGGKSRKHAERLNIPYKTSPWGVDDYRDAFRHGFTNAYLTVKIGERISPKLAAGVVKALGDLDETEAAIERRFKVDPNSHRMDIFNSFQGIRDGLECLARGVLDEERIADYVANKLNSGDYIVGFEDLRRFSATDFLKMLVSKVK